MYLSLLYNLPPWSLESNRRHILVYMRAELSGFSSRHQYVNEYRVRYAGGKISEAFLRHQYVFKVD
jgi:hypothetical protein